MTRRYILPLILLIIVGCESSPRPKESAATIAPAPPMTLDTAELIATAQTLRDRDFAAAPKVEAVTELQTSELPGCEARCTQERRWLTRVLFGGKPPVFPRPVAQFDPAERVVRVDASKPEKARRAAALAELVRALDDVQVEVADSWDAYLASCALRRGSGVFVAALDRAQARNESIDAERLAMRPEGIYDLEFTQNRFADGFATREGFAFVAAMVRSGGWSTAELAFNERPTRTMEIVRPDRYLNGEQPGDWTLPAELQLERSKRGLELVRDGRVGPALFAEWLAQHVPSAAARAVYIGFEADAYQLYASGEQWTFDWVSLWATPSIAQQVVEALDAGLRTRQDGAKFAVLRQGTTVAVVGSTRPENDLTTPATALVGTLPVFRPAAPRGVAFVPTPIDRITARPLVSSVPRAPWTDLATGLTLDLGTLPESWQILPTQEPNLPWFAKHESGAVLQYLVEPQPLFDPPFDSVEYEKVVADRFSATVVSEESPRVTRSDAPVKGGIRIEAQGKIKDRSAEGVIRLHAWQFADGPFITTLSLQAAPASFDARRAELATLLSSLKVDQSASEDAHGVIEFTVEE